MIKYRKTFNVHTFVCMFELLEQNFVYKKFRTRAVCLKMTFLNAEGIHLEEHLDGEQHNEEKVRCFLK